MLNSFLSGSNQVTASRANSTNTGTSTPFGAAQEAAIAPVAVKASTLRAGVTGKGIIPATLSAPNTMNLFESIAVFQNTEGINSIINTINAMIRYYNSKISSLNTQVSSDMKGLKTSIKSSTDKINTLSANFDTLSAKVDTLMNPSGEFGSAPPSEGGRRSKRRTMKKRK
jgi:hypothetical protein